MPSKGFQKRFNRLVTDLEAFKRALKNIEKAFKRLLNRLQKVFKRLAQGLQKGFKRPVQGLQKAFALYHITFSLKCHTVLQHGVLSTEGSPLAHDFRLCHFNICSPHRGGTHHIDSEKNTWVDDITTHLGGKGRNNPGKQNLGCGGWVVLAVCDCSEDPWR